MARLPGTPKSGERLPFDGEWCTVREIAERANMPPTTLRSRIQAAFRGSKTLAVRQAVLLPLERRKGREEGKSFSPELIEKINALWITRR